MQSEEKSTTHSWANRRHERFALLARGEEKLRELVRSGQMSEAAAIAKQGWSKLVGAVRSTTPSSLADHLREAVGEAPRAPRTAAAPSDPGAAPGETAARPSADPSAPDADADALRRLRDVELGNPVFVREGREPCGAVREIHFGATPTLTIHIENAGEFAVPAQAVRAVHDGKVVLDADRLDAALRAAIAHAHDAEQPGP